MEFTLWYTGASKGRLRNVGGVSTPASFMLFMGVRDICSWRHHSMFTCLICKAVATKYLITLSHFNEINSCIPKHQMYTNPRTHSLARETVYTTPLINQQEEGGIWGTLSPTLPFSLFLSLLLLADTSFSSSWIWNILIVVTTRVTPHHSGVHEVFSVAWCSWMDECYSILIYMKWAINCCVSEH